MSNYFKLAVLSLAISLSISCKKAAEAAQSRRCWKCTMTVSYTPSNLGSPSSSTNSMCDMTQDEINTYQKAGTATATSTSGGITVTVKTTTTCSAQ